MASTVKGKFVVRLGSKYARKNYYLVRDRSSGKILSRHYKLSKARDAAKGKGNHIRIEDQDGRAFG